MQITVPDDVLPTATRRLINDLRTLTTNTGAALSIRRPAADPVEGDRVGRLLPEQGVDEPQLRLVEGGRSVRIDGDPRPVLYLDTSSRTVRRNGDAIHLSRREYDLLSFLCKHPRRVFGRAQLLRNVWGYEMVGGERTVDVHVRRLRAKLGSCADGIVTVRGVGYRFDDQAAVAVVVDGD